MARDFGFMPMEGTDYYFISYNSEDSDRVGPIAQSLFEKGVPLWYDQGLKHGKNWEKQIAEKISHARAVLLFFTKGILAKPKSFVHTEYEMATEFFGKDVYVIFLDSIQKQDIPADKISWWIDINKKHNLVALNQEELAADRIIQALLASGAAEEEMPAAAPPERLAAASLPRCISLFELLGIRNMDEFPIEQQWDSCDITQSMRVPIGVDERGERVYLDLHQRKDGPNGLIAGPAGSGKSEFLYTFLLSAALHFPPDQLQLHLADPHGEYTLREIGALPHLGISLTQFTPPELDAFFSYFEKELARRDALFTQYGVKNIYQYLKKARMDHSMPAMAHLVIGIDSFRTIKRDYPEVGYQLLQLGMRKNTETYGFHLIWATQSPEGLIDDTLYHLTNFKICSRGLYDCEAGNDAGNDAQDTLPGRLYLQTQTHDAIRALQLAYSGSVAADNSALGGYRWFFMNKSQRQAIVQAIERCCMD